MSTPSSPWQHLHGPSGLIPTGPDLFCAQIPEAPGAILGHFHQLSTAIVTMSLPWDAFPTCCWQDIPALTPKPDRPWKGTGKSSTESDERQKGEEKVEEVQWEGSSDGVVQQEWGFGNGQSSPMQQFLTGKS